MNLKVLPDESDYLIHEIDPDLDQIIQTYDDLAELEYELIQLNDIMQEFNLLVMRQDQDLQSIDDTMENVDVLTQEAVIDLVDGEHVDTQTTRQLAYTIGGAIIGGLLTGGIGSIFGVVPAVCSGLTGLGLGSIGGRLTSSLNK